METFEGLLIDTYVLQEQPMMLTGINLQLEDRVINGLLKDRYLAKYILRLPLNKYVLLSVSSGQLRELYYWG